jgi:hypothetical protein
MLRRDTLLHLLPRPREAPLPHVEPFCRYGSSLHRDPGRDLTPRLGRASAAGGSRRRTGEQHQPAAARRSRSVRPSPDGWHLEVGGANETQLPVAPLTTAISSREYLIAGTFTGKITGGGKTKLTGGSIEAGEQIGCGIISDETEINPGASFQPGINLPFTGPFNFGVSLQGKIYLKPGTVTTVAIDKKSFKGTSTRITITGVRIKTDQCAGQSFIRSYATLTSSTDNTDDVITYLGVTKSV